MAVIKYKDKNGNWRTLTESVNVSVDTEAKNVYVGELEELVPLDCRVWYDTSHTPPLCKVKVNEEWLTVAGGGGSSDGTGNSDGVKLTPAWYMKTLAYGNMCELEIKWSSYYGGNPTTMIDYELVVKPPEGEEIKKESAQVLAIGTKTINLTPYLDLGSTQFIIRLRNDKGKFAEAPITVTTVSLTMKENFSESDAYTSDTVHYRCTPDGANNKEQKLYIELDGELVVDGQDIEENNQQLTIPLTVTTHGKHSICAWFTCQLEEGEKPIESDKVYSEFARIVRGNTTPIVVANCGVDRLIEYDNTTFDWYVFTPNVDGTVAEYTPKVEIYHNTTNTLAGAKRVKELVNIPKNLAETHSFRAEHTGDNYIIFKVGDDISTSIHISVEESGIDVNAITSNLILNLSPRDHTNRDPDKEHWVSETVDGGKVTATLTGFTFGKSDGWITDDIKETTVLTLRDTAEVNTPDDFKIFTESALKDGVTIEIEIATHDVLDYEATILECMNNGVGIEVKANQAMLSTKNNSLVTPFREDEQVRITFVIEPTGTTTKLMLIYINGVLSGAKQFTSSDSFAQDVPQGIKIGSPLCATDIYAIRVYKTALGRKDILKNWIADTQNRELLLERYNRNKLITETTGVNPNNIPEDLAYLVFYTNEAGLPQAKGKGEQRYLNGKYIDANRSFTFNNVEVKVQGTSSSGYPRKNFTMTFENEDGEAVPIIFTGKRDGIDYVNEPMDDFKMFDDSVPTNSFCFKADYASSEGANNVELVKLFNDIAPHIPPQEDNGVRQGIDGFPMVIFCYYEGVYYFIGKYNFNNDKGTPEVYGMTDGVESWEITNNGTDMGEYKEDDFDTIITVEKKDVTTGEVTFYETEKWLETFEARYPEDNLGYENLKDMVSWVRSTWRGEADPKRKLAEPVTYGDVTYEYDSVDYRRVKFINEVSDWFDVDHLCFFYLFTAFFLMIDNREKNTFPTRYFNKELNRWLWYFLPYDFDTALGINNSGELVFGHGLEDYDEGIYNGADSVLWCNTRDYLADKIENTYIELRNNDIFNYDEIVRRFSEHQKAWGEAVFNEDSYYKYIDILFDKGIKENHLNKLQGNKEAQMRHWLLNRFRYFDAKYVTKDIKKEIIIIRPNYSDFDTNKHSLNITPYTDTYLSVNFDNMSGSYKPIPQRAFKGTSVSFDNPKGKSENAVVHIYNASQITDLGDLSEQYTSEFQGGSATRLQRLILGSDDIINNQFKTLSLGDNKLLKVLNVKNCPNLVGEINIEGCIGIEEVYLQGTGVTSVTLSRGGSCRKLHLPETITNLTVRNHKVTEFSMPNFNNLSTLWLELNETSKGTFDLKTILNTMITRFKNSAEGALGRLRVIDFELTGDKGFSTGKDLVDFCTDLRRYFKGLNEQGEATDDEKKKEEYLRGMLQGTIQVTESRGITQYQLDEVKSKFPYVTLIYNGIRKPIVTFVDSSGNVLSTQTVECGQKPVMPKHPTEGSRYICDREFELVTDDETYVLTTEYPATFRFDWVIGNQVITTYQTYNPEGPGVSVKRPSGYDSGTIIDIDGNITDDSGDLSGKFAIVGYSDSAFFCTEDRTVENGNPIYAILKPMARIEGLTWGMNGIPLDTDTFGGTISEATETSFKAKSNSGGYALRKLDINTSELDGIGYDTTIQSITVHFTVTASEDHGWGLGSVDAVMGYAYSSGLEFATISTVEIGTTEISSSLKVSYPSVALTSAGSTKNLWFGLSESLTAKTVEANFTNVSFDITYHTND